MSGKPATFPVVGGRLRIVHEANQSLSIQTEIIRLEADSVVVKASVQTDKGSFTVQAQRQLNEMLD